MIPDWLHVDRSQAVRNRLKKAIHRALQSNGADRELEKIAEQILYCNRRDVAAVSGQVQRILNKAYDIAREHNRQAIAFRLLYKEINFFHSFSRLPELLGYAIRQKRFDLLKALVQAIGQHMSQAVFNQDLLQQVGEVLFEAGREKKDVLLWSAPVLRAALPEQQFVTALKMMGLWCMQQKDYGGAISFYQELQAMDRLDLPGLETLCLAMAKADRFAEALSLGEQAVRNGTHNTTLLAMLGRHYQEQADRDRAVSIYLLLDSLQPENIHNKQAIAENYLAQGKEEEALHYLKQVIKLNPSARESRKADVLFRRILAQRPGDIDLVKHHLHFLEAVGDYKGLKKQNLVLGKLYYGQAMYDQALEHFVNLQDFADAQGDLYYQRKILEYIYRIQLKQNQYKSALATVHSLLSVCQRINDTHGLSLFTKEQVKIKRKLAGFSASKIRPAGAVVRTRPKSQVIDNLRLVAGEVLGAGRSEQKPAAPANVFLGERVDDDVRDVLATAVTRRRQGRLKEAKELLIAAIKQIRSLPLPYFHLFHLFVREKDVLAAKTTVLAALKIRHLTAEEKSRLLLLLAYAQEKCNNPGKACKILELARQLNHTLRVDERLSRLQQQVERRRLEERVDKLLRPIIQDT